MFDYSMMDNANRIIEEGARKNVKLTEFIAHEIAVFKGSKKYKHMLEGSRYYKGEHDILKKNREMISTEGKKEVVTNLPNSKNVDNQYKKMVKQKYNYLLGKPMSIQSDNKDYADLLNEILNNNFHRLMKNVCKDSLNCGIGWLYVYYNEQGELQFKKFKPYEIIPGWKNTEHTVLDYVIRVYEVEVFNGVTDETVTKVEHYTLQGIDYYEYYNGTLVASAPYHTDYLNIDGKAFNWDKLPFIPFKYNEEEIPLINNCKSLQDGLNEIVSNFEDNMLEDMRNTILVLVNYDGTDLGEFRRNLATYGAVKVTSVDGMGGDVKTLKIEVNAENYKALIEIFKKAIVENCMGYDAKDERMSGTPNQMNIQSMYNDIDLDASDMETEYQASLEELLWFINAHLSNTGVGDYMNEGIDIIFNTDMPMDESTTINNIQGSAGILSTETLVANHPWVDDPVKELERLEKEKQKNIDQYSGVFDNNVSNVNNQDKNSKGVVADV